MLERGFSGFDLAEVARASGLTRQTVYNHFDSRAALLVALVDHVYETERPVALLDQFRLESSPEAMLESAAHVSSVYLPRIFDWARVLYSTGLEDPAARAAWKHRMRQRKANATGIAKRLASSGKLARAWSKADARDLVFMLLSLHTYEYLVVESGWSIAKYRRLLSSLLKRVLLD
jgi:AcrR family transcriptional regulator